MLCSLLERTVTFRTSECVVPINFWRPKSLGSYPDCPNWNLVGMREKWLMFRIPSPLPLSCKGSGLLLPSKIKLEINQRRILLLKVIYLPYRLRAVSYTHLRAHETDSY